jgi:hypothetical protein
MQKIALPLDPQQMQICMYSDVNIVVGKSKPLTESFAIVLYADILCGYNLVIMQAENFVTSLHVFCNIYIIFLCK